MADNNGLTIDLADEACRMLEEYAAKVNKSQDQVIEYIIGEFLQNQLPVLKKLAGESGRPLGELINKQFARILEYLSDGKSQKPASL